MEENIEETLSFYRLPRQHHKHPKLTNMLERLMEEIKRPPLVVRIFPNGAACLRLIRAPAAEMHENWIEATRYLKMEPLAEQEKEALRRLGEAASTLSCSGLRPPQLSVHQREEHQIQRICRT